jgi:hypothetical protein
MKPILIKGIPAELWRAVKSRAAIEGRLVKEVIIDLLQKYLGGV